MTRTADQQDAARAFVDATTRGGPLDGRVVRPGDGDWDAARAAFQLAVDQRPVAVVRAGSPADVVATVRAAAAAGVRVTVQGTGHNAGPLGPLDDTVLLRTDALQGVRIDAGRRTARVEAGARWGAVVDAAAPHGLAALAGSSPDVGVVGYTLGGGLSWLGRAHGLASGQVVAAEVVTADGARRRVDGDHEPELFWALRGGGGSFAVVTALEFRLLPVAEVVAGALFWPIERAADVLHAWRRWTADAPEEITSVGRVLRMPPLPELPGFLRGRSLVSLEFASLQDAAATDRHLAGLRALRPEVDTVGPMPVTGLSELHRDASGPVHAAVDGVALAQLAPGTLDAWLAEVGPGVETPLLSVEIRHAGGALRRGRADAGALSGLDAAYLVVGATISPDPAVLARGRRALGELAAALSPWSTTGYGNFAETPRPASALFDAATLHRLRTVKSAYDPRDLLRANHPVPRAP